MPTRSWWSSFARNCSSTHVRRRKSPSSFVSAAATITATTSFPPSWKIICVGMPRGCKPKRSPGPLIRLRRAVVGREQPVSQQIARSTGPGFVGIAAYVVAHRRYELAGMGVRNVDIHIQNKVRNLLNHARDREIGPELLCVARVATAAGLQVAAVRRSINRGAVEDRKLSGFRQCLAQLIAGAHQPLLFVGPRPIHFALKAGVH